MEVASSLPLQTAGLRAHEELWGSRWQLRTANLSESEDKVPPAQEYTPGAFTIPRNLATLGTAPQLLHTSRLQTLHNLERTASPHL